MRSPLKLIYDGPNKIYENTEAFPRAWVVHQATRVAPNDIEAIKVFLQDPAHDLALEAVVEIDEPIDWHTNLSTESSAPSDEVGVNSYAPERVVIEAELETPGLLVLSDVMYPGWRAYVDGIERPILTTNLIMRSVYLEGGAHTVEFVFKPYVFMTGLAISTITIVIISVAFVLASKKRQPPDSQGFAGVVAEHPRTYHPEDSQRAGPQE